MKRLTLILILILSFAVPVGSARAQATEAVRITPDSMVTQLTLRDGSVLIGRVVQVDDTNVTFMSSIGQTTFPRSAIAEVKLLEKERLHDGQLWPEDPSRSRLMFAPTGRMMHAGESYLTDAYVFFPSVQVGLTDKLSIGLGASVLPGIDLDENILYLTPKLGLYSSPKLNIAIGALFAAGKVVSDAAPVGLAYGVATIGDENDSFTAGGGFGFANGNTSSLGVLMLGGSTRTTKNIALVTENYLAVTNSSASVFSGGVRFIGEKMSVDLALWGGAKVNILVPYVAFIYRF